MLSFFIVFSVCWFVVLVFSPFCFAVVVVVVVSDDDALGEWVAQSVERRTRD